MNTCFPTTEIDMRDAIQMLFEAYFDQDSLRIESALRHLEFLQGLKDLAGGVR